MKTTLSLVVLLGLGPQMRADDGSAASTNREPVLQPGAFSRPPTTFERPSTTFSAPSAPTLPVTGGTFSRPESTFARQPGTFASPTPTNVQKRVPFMQLPPPPTAAAPAETAQSAPDAVKAAEPEPHPRVENPPTVVDFPVGARVRR